MEFNFIRDKTKVHPTLRELNDQLRTIKGCKIYVPVRFTERGLASVGAETYIVGIFPIVVEDKYYALNNVPARVRIDPTSTTIVQFDDEDYYEFYFEPGSVVISSLNLVKEDTLTYLIYNEFMSKAKVPVGVQYRDIGKLFRNALKHAGTDVGETFVTIELIASLVARNKDDKRQYYRSMLKTEKDLETIPNAWVSLRNVHYSSTNTVNKLAGSHFKTGLVSAMVSPAERPERIETILRG